LPHTWNSGMSKIPSSAEMESWNVGLQKHFFIFKDFELPCQYEFYQSHDLEAFRPRATRLEPFGPEFTAEGLVDKPQGRGALDRP